MAIFFIGTTFHRRGAQEEKKVRINGGILINVLL